MARFLDFIFARGRARYGGYELIEEIARGGMSRIWKARQPDSGKVVALKILTPESAETQDGFRRLFEAEEGTIALGLDHPNVIKTFGYGRGRDNEYYIAMEYIEGPNLEQMIRVESALMRRLRFDLLLEVGEGLRYIHSRGLVHRDFCPKNVMLGKDEVPKIIDFGLTIPATASSKNVITRAGTASYMAPEQVRNQDVDAATDVYGYGVSAYEILTFQRPWPRTSDRTHSMLTHLNLEPLPLRQLAPELPEEMERVVRKCIAKERELRYKTMDEVMGDLQAAVEIARRGHA